MSESMLILIEHSASEGTLYNSQESKSEKTSWGLSSRLINTSSPSKERIINNLTAALLTRSHTKVSQKTRKSLKMVDFNPSTEPLDEINIPNSAV